MQNKTHSRLLLAVLLFPFFSFAQQASVTIRTVNSKGDALPYSSITLVLRQDSTISFHAVADSMGSARFTALPAGQFLATITSVNYQPLQTGITVAESDLDLKFELDPLPQALGAVVVTSRKPLITQEDDKTIVDPENMVATSSSGYEVIEKTPGLFVDQDGNIYISSMTPATVYINGREMKMSAADIATMLKSLPPHAISKIEILRTPSAKYDASNSGGIVNVILKKGVKIGLTGSLNAGAYQGDYGTQYVGASLNYNDGKKSMYLNANYSRRNSYERVITDRLFATDSLLRQQAFTKYPASVYFTSYGYSNSLSKKWDIDFAGSVTLNDFNNSTENRSVISKISTDQTLTENLTGIGNKGNTLIIGDGVTFKLKIDSLGSDWSNDFYFNYTHGKTGQDYLTSFISPAIPSVGGAGDNETARSLFVYTNDLKLKLKQRLTVEAGIKSSLLGFNSDALYTRQQQPDPGRTSKFHYRENINSGYVQGSKTLGKDFVIKAGLRLENTNMNGHQEIPVDTNFTVHRTDLFPYIYLSKNLMTIMGYDLRAYLVYRRTITRPVYEQLNPFPKYVDQYLSDIGNPSLRPQFTQNFEANISVDERPILAVGVNDTKDIFTNVIYQADSSRAQAYRTYDNLGKNREWYLRGLGAIPPGKRYFMVLGAQYNHNFYQGLYEEKPLHFKKGTWTFFTYQSFNIDKRSTLTLNGFLRLKGQQQFYELEPFGALQSSVNRKFMKDKLVLTLSVSDIFASNKNEFTINQGSVNASGLRSNDSRRVGLSMRYNFGIRKKEENKGGFLPTDIPAQ